MPPAGFREMADNARAIVAIELLAAAQGIEFHAPTPTSEPLAAVWREIRGTVPYYDRDRPFAPDIAAAESLIRGPLFRSLVADILPS
jgi:histidine ammonia-lyase